MKTAARITFAFTSILLVLPWICGAEQSADAPGAESVFTKEYRVSVGFHGWLKERFFRRHPEEVTDSNDDLGLLLSSEKITRLSALLKDEGITFGENSGVMLTGAEGTKLIFRNTQLNHEILRLLLAEFRNAQGKGWLPGRSKP